VYKVYHMTLGHYCLSGTSAPGPVPEGTIRVYSMHHCPFAQRTVFILKAKGINHEIVNINLKNKPEWFFEKSPFGMVPVLETSKGQLIYESPITCEYLDEAYPEKKLYPADPYEKAYQKMLLEFFSKVLLNIKCHIFLYLRCSQTTKLKFFEAFQLLECLDHTPGLKCWIDLMKLDPAVQATITDPQIFKGFLELYFNNSIEACDYGL
uniref:Glutathione S-transferase omega n=1 Tax=Naja naja TaxID=35670 RepID=A0A8C7E3A4_NAJNA